MLGDGVEHETETKHDDLGDTTEITQQIKESIDSPTMCNRCLIHKHNRLIERVLKFWNRVIHGSSLDLLNDILNIIKYVTDELTKLNPVFRCLNRIYPKEGVIHLHQVWIDERLALHLHDRVGRLLVILRKNYLSLNKPFFYSDILGILLYFCLIFAISPDGTVAHLYIPNDLS